ncbi:hypothetical protein FOZ60_000255 [Perkinsus olseni]|uniref:Uncharacterized protein n=1 Tax=Perkinsus olseni TaxID=32597 RepID=A0A7J6P3R8_PEROL|nr:hypothetical protein FOZ60_000255 [Perkinsus olseni]
MKSRRRIRLLRRETLLAMVIVDTMKWRPRIFGISYSFCRAAVPLRWWASLEDTQHSSTTSPEYNRNFHLAGESFAGHYIPVIADKILQENKRMDQGASSPPKQRIDFRGMAIGNGDTDNPHSAPYMAEMAMVSGAVNRSTYQQMLASVPPTTELMLRCTEILGKLKQPANLFTAPETCLDANLEYMMNFLAPVEATGRNIYDLRLNGTYNFSRYINFLNNATIMKTLGAGKKWKPINYRVTLDLYFDDTYRIYNPEVERVLEAGVKVLIYAGDKDYLCNWLVNDAWTKRLQWSGAQQFVHRPLELYQAGTTEVVGEMRRTQNLAFVRVYNAGHLVPHDQPKEQSGDYRAVFEWKYVRFCLDGLASYPWALSCNQDFVVRPHNDVNVIE